MKGSPLGPGGEDITWPDQVAPQGRKASSTRKIKPQTSNLIRSMERWEGCDRGQELCNASGAAAPCWRLTTARTAWSVTPGGTCCGC